MILWVLMTIAFYVIAVTTNNQPAFGFLAINIILLSLFVTGFFGFFAILSVCIERTKAKRFKWLQVIVTGVEWLPIVLVSAQTNNGFIITLIALPFWQLSLLMFVSVLTMVETFIITPIDSPY